MQIENSEIELALKENHPDMFKFTDRISTSHFSRTNAYCVERWTMDEQGNLMPERGVLYYTYKKTLFGKFVYDTGTFTLFNVENIPTNAVENSLKKILKNLGVCLAYNITVVNTGTYKVLSYDGLSNYIYGGATIHLNREEGKMEVISEEYKPYGRPEAYEKISDW